METALTFLFWTLGVGIAMYLLLGLLVFVLIVVKSHKKK